MSEMSARYFFIMPRSSSGKTKSQRMHALRQVLARWGRLDKPKIDELVAAYLKVPANGIRKPLYRDLKELVDAGEMTAHYFTADGKVIENYDRDLYLHTKAEWALVGAECRLIGQSALSAAGAVLFPFSDCSRDLKIEDNPKSLEPDHTHIFFGINSSFFCMRLSGRAAPFSIIFSRVSGGSEARLSLKSISADYGKRGVLLQIPSPGISGTKVGIRAGHAVITFTNEEKFRIKDLESKNGTSVRCLSFSEAEALRKSGELLGRQTLVTDWFALVAEFERTLKCTPLKEHRFSLPAIVTLSRDFQVLIVRHPKD